MQDAPESQIWRDRTYKQRGQNQTHRTRMANREDGIEKHGAHLLNRKGRIRQPLGGCGPLCAEDKTHYPTDPVG